MMSSNSKASPWINEKLFVKGKKIDFEQAVESNPTEIRPIPLSANSGFGINNITMNMNLTTQINHETNITKPAPSYDLASLEQSMRNQPIIIPHYRGPSPPPICTCTKTGCKKKYCACYQKGYSCNPKCECKSCKNNKQEDYTMIYPVNRGFGMPPGRMPIGQSSFIGLGINAFGGQSSTEDVICNCSRSNCTKKYCECYKVGKICSEACRCVNCENTAEWRAKRKEKEMEEDNKIIESNEAKPEKKISKKNLLKELRNESLRAYGIGVYICGQTIEIEDRDVPLLSLKKDKKIKKEEGYLESEGISEDEDKDLRPYIKEEDYDDLDSKEKRKLKGKKEKYFLIRHSNRTLKRDPKKLLPEPEDEFAIKIPESESNVKGPLLAIDKQFSDDIALTPKLGKKTYRENFNGLSTNYKSEKQNDSELSAKKEDRIINIPVMKMDI
ncbi:MAG: TCR domain-containing protein [archaeon]|nr:TCR domain-containing protein [archaeon]